MKDDLCEICDGDAALASTPCASNAVSVVLNAPSHVIVDDVRYVLDVNPAPCHVRGDENVLGAGLELRQRGLSGALGVGGRMRFDDGLVLGQVGRSLNRKMKSNRMSLMDHAGQHTHAHTHTHTHS